MTRPDKGEKHRTRTGTEQKKPNKSLQQMKDTSFPNGTSEDDIRLVYQIAVSNMAFLKNLQWNLIYYGVLLYGAAVGLATIRSGFIRWVSFAIAIFTFFVSMLFLYELLDKM